MVFKRVSSDEATSLFRQLAPQYINRGDRSGLKKLYVELATTAQMSDGPAGLAAMRATYREVLLASQPNIQRGTFDDCLIK